mmetsp:Transcript_28708/g.73615  ORF Transcript_28708/g.73615 Transcript_28708/m.73615 type:complete len:232 (+) Transcript_28708:1091-1786(+)
MPSTLHLVSNERPAACARTHPVEIWRTTWPPHRQHACRRRRVGGIGGGRGSSGGGGGDGGGGKTHGGDDVDVGSQGERAAGGWTGGLTPASERGFGDGSDDAQPPPLPPSTVLAPVWAPPVVVNDGVMLPAETEGALLELMDASGCESDEGRAISARTCELAEVVLRHIRLEREDHRERYAEREAGEAMERLTRAFVLLCILRIVIAQQQRRHMLMERQLAWDRRDAALPV